MPRYETGAYSRPVASIRRTSRGEGARGASFGRLGDVVVSSKRVRRVMTKRPSGCASTSTTE